MFNKDGEAERLRGLVHKKTLNIVCQIALTGVLYYKGLWQRLRAPGHRWERRGRGEDRIRWPGFPEGNRAQAIETISQIKIKQLNLNFLFPGSCLSPPWTSPRARFASCTSRDSNSSPPIWGWGSSTSQTLRPQRPGYCLNLNLNIQSKYIYCWNRCFFKKGNFCRVVSCGDRLKTAMGVAVDPAGEK